MAFSHGKLAVVTVDNAAGTPVALTAYTTEVSFPREVEASEVTVFGNGNKQYIPGLADATVSMSGPFDPVVHTQMNAIAAAQIAGTLAAVTIRYEPAGTGGGTPYYTAEGLLTSYEPSSSVGDPNEWSAEFQITGAVTTGTN